MSRASSKKRSRNFATFCTNDDILTRVSDETLGIILGIVSILICAFLYWGGIAEQKRYDKPR